MPMDAAIILADERIIGVVRQGLTSDRTSFSKRMWRLREDVPRPSAVLILAPDEVRLRHARRLSTGTPTLLALERDAALCGTGDPIWHQPSINATLDLEYVLSRLEQGGPLPTEAEPSRVFLPGDIALEEPVQDLPGHLLPVLLKPGEKRALDALSDWPWITLKYLAGLLGVSAPRVSQLLIRLEALGLVTRIPASGRRLALTGQGLSLLARRDRTSVGAARRRWSADSLDPEGHPSGATSPAPGAASCSGTSSTPKPSIASSQRWLIRHALWAGSCRRSTRPGGPPGIFATESGSTRSTPTLTAQSAGPMRRGPSSWSGSAGRYAP